MKLLLFTLCFICAFSSTADVTNLVASVDQNPVIENESFTLQLTATGNITREDIDFSVLEKNFRVSVPSVSQSTQIINGNRSSSVTWRVTLFPKNTGKFTIPSFTLGNQTSKAINMDVVSATANVNRPREFYLTTAVSNSKLYLQQQITYTVKLYLAGDIQSGSLGEPQLAGAIIEKVGDDKEYQELINGINYRIVERSFAIIPQSSGTFEIESPLFEARVLSGSRQSFAYFNRTKTINRVGPPQTINVQPIPANYPYPWLPSEMVQIQDEWQGGEDALVAGEPITHTVTLTALGLIEEQLPNIDINYHPSFKTYPELAQKATVQRDNKLIAQTVQNVAIIPESAGDFILPEIRVPWFNVKTGETEFAVLPAKKVNVAANDSAEIHQENTEQTDVSPTDINTESSVSTKPQSNAILWILDWLHISLLAICAVLLILVMYLGLSKSKQGTLHEKQVKNSNDDEGIAWEHLSNAIHQRRIGKLPNLLCAWLNTITKKQYASASEGLSENSTASYKAFDELLSSRYSTTGGELNTNDLFSKLSQLREDLQQKTQATARLYPQ
ncbi:BatD family protein [Agaribacter marinus]|uniref:Protein BatD n=1 Tax=Agaribacter marinus TaxID=1431249 RepID=A0AA37T194_9ALTE|nr:BatD family protein [Agaribacter marinus]GLR72024.1 hypothetical protein GCM10007852_29320 [Agaribacter marinus]